MVRQPKRHRAAFAKLRWQEWRGIRREENAGRREWQFFAAERCGKKRRRRHARKTRSRRAAPGRLSRAGVWCPAAVSRIHAPAQSILQDWRDRSAQRRQEGEARQRSKEVRGPWRVSL